MCLIQAVNVNSLFQGISALIRRKVSLLIRRFTSRLNKAFMPWIIHDIIYASNSGGKFEMIKYECY